MDVLKEIKKGFKKIKKIEPSDIVKAIDESAKELKIKAKTIVGGSVAKGTYLEVHDCDIFVRFSENKELSEKLKKILKNKFKNIELLHGSRDYYQIKKNNITYEIVPVLDIKKSEQAKNITDVSPLHAEWVNKNIKSLKDDVRLAKLFCKANECYGAESFIKGFSGYILEILIIYYGGFINLLKEGSRWKPKDVIDIKKYHKNVFNKINESKLHSPLIVIDPVDKSRNAAAALDKEKFNLFIDASKNFLNKPSKRFFVKKRFNIKKLEEKAVKNNHKLIKIEILPENGKRDIIGARILRVYEHIKKQLKFNDFPVYDSGWHWNKKAILWYELDKKIELKVKRVGPKTYSKKENIEKFKEKYKKTFIEDKIYYAWDKRRYVKPEKYLTDLINDDWFKPKIKRIILSLCFSQCNDI